MPPSHLGDFLRRPDVVDNDAELCVIYNNYIQTPVFLETVCTATHGKHTQKRRHIDDVKQFCVYSLQESLPAVVRRPTLPCVWPVALSSSSRSEANAWFDRRLPSYLVFLSKTLIGSNVTHNASCMAFQKLYVCFTQHYVIFFVRNFIFLSLNNSGFILFFSVSVLGEHNFTAADFTREDFFNTIRSYLTSGQSSD